VTDQAGAATPADVDSCSGCTGTSAGGPGAADPGWRHAARLARRLAWASLVWMTVEGVLGLVAGFSVGSIALVGWALGSAIEGLASLSVVWRFTGSRTVSDAAERRAQKAVAVSLWLLAPYIAIEAVRDLIGAHHAGTSLLGIVVTAASVAVMPGLGIVKHRLGARLGSEATAGEGTQNLLCAAQAGAVLIGLAVTALWSGGSWVDPLIALGIAGWSIREGIGAWRGEDCC
jgi:divalent metal cation (Fe/Co/Zn/Cd) transporter